jgi:nitrogen fixation NifU-like protein
VSDQGDVKDINRILEDIQRQIAEQERAIYTPTVIEHAYHPRNWGRMDRADARRIWQGPCGDTMEIYLRLDKEGTDKAAIRVISFMTDGCGSSVVALGGLPQESAHCAFLAVHTLHEAILNWYRSAHTRSKERDDG